MVTTHRLGKRAGFLAIAVLCLTAGLGGRALALDFNEVVTLLQSGVDETIIINMAKADTRLYITTEQADQLYGMGASQNLVAALRPRPTSAPATSTTTVIEAQPSTTTTVVESQPLSTTVVETTTVTPADGSPIVPAPVAQAAAVPRLWEKEGWLSIYNRDWKPYFLNIDIGEKRMFLSKNPNGGVVVQSGENLVLNVRKEGYKLYGDSGKNLEVKIREGETTTLSLEPFGIFGNSGLTGVSANRDKVRSEVLFNNYVPPAPVIIQEPAPVVVVPSYPPPPPVIYYRRPPYYRYDNGGWGGFYFEYNR